MRHLAAYLLACLSETTGNPNAAIIKSILSSVGVEADDKQVEVLLKQFSGMTVPNAMKEGRNMMASMPSGGAIAVSGSGGQSGAPAAAEASSAAPAKEEKKEEPEEESDDDMGFGLFD